MYPTQAKQRLEWATLGLVFGQGVLRRTSALVFRRGESVRSITNSAHVRWGERGGPVQFLIRVVWGEGCGMRLVSPTSREKRARYGAPHVLPEGRFLD